MNSFGRIFRVSFFGESHGPALGVVIDGCPPGVSLAAEDFCSDLARRKPGSLGTTPRVEADEPLLESGVFQGRTTGAPLVVRFENRAMRSADYDHLRDRPRPGSADFVAREKFFDCHDPRGGGHFSGRITLALVAAGVVAKKILQGCTFQAKLLEAGGEADIERAVRSALAVGDSLGGLVECRVSGVPVGWGEPWFDSVESVLSHLLFAIPAVKGVAFGDGFACARMRGSEFNDALIARDGTTSSNHAGGIVGGLSNGNEIVFRVAIRPASSIAQAQAAFNLATAQPEELVIGGRHDACIALRVPVVVEAAAAVVLADFMMLRDAQRAWEARRV